MKQGSNKPKLNTTLRKKRREAFYNQQTKANEPKLMMKPDHCKADAVRRIIRIVLCDIRNNPEFLKHFATQKDDGAFLQIKSQSSAEESPRQNLTQAPKRKKAKRWQSTGRRRRKRGGSSSIHQEATGCSSDDDFDFPVFRDNRLWLPGQES